MLGRDCSETNQGVRSVKSVHASRSFREGMDSMVKKSLGAPLRHLTSCVTQVKEAHRGRRRSLTGRRRSAPCLSHATHDSWIRAYQADLIRERNLRKTVVAQKNAQRASNRAYFSSQHPMPRDTRRCNSTTKPQFPREFHGISRSHARSDDSMFGAFQGLSLNVGNGPTTNAEQCKVM